MKKTKTSKTKAMKKSDRKSLLQLLHGINAKTIRDDIVTNLRATFRGNVLLKEFADVVCSTE